MAERGDSGGIILGSKYGSSRHDGVCARLYRLSGAGAIFSAIDFDEGIEATRLAELPQMADFREHRRHEFLSAEAGMDRHDE